MRDYLDEYIVATRLIHRNEGASIEELSKALGKTERAVFQILAQLDMMLFPIYDMKDLENPKKKRYHADKSLAEYLPDLKFTEDDKAVFNYLVDSADNTPAMEVKARHLFTKLRLMASERGALIEHGNRKTLSMVSRSNIVKNVDYKKITNFTSIFIDAVSNRQWVKISYQDAYQREYNWDIYPLVLFVEKGDSYVASLTKKGDLKAVALERIQEILKIYDDPVPEGNYDLDTLLNEPFGIVIDMDKTPVKLQIDAAETYYESSKRWPETVSFEKKEDGSSIMTVKTSSRYGVESWILARTPHVKVLEPQWLKDSIKEKLKEGLEIQ